MAQFYPLVCSGGGAMCVLELVFWQWCNVTCQSEWSGCPGSCEQPGLQDDGPGMPATADKIMQRKGQRWEEQGDDRASRRGDQDGEEGRLGLSSVH